MGANERQVGGFHYAGGYQHWDFVHDALHGCYLEGCITKYVTRWRKKDGIRDLEKAEHYLDKLIEGIQSGIIVPYGDETSEELTKIESCVKRFINVSQLNADEAKVVELVAKWTCTAELEQARVHIHMLKARVGP
jgi:hypothetical protein